MNGWRERKDWQLIRFDYDKLQEITKRQLKIIKSL